MGAILRLLGGIGLGALNGIFSVFSAGMNGALSLAKSAMNTALQYHQQGIEFARSMGMSLQQAQAYTTVLTNRAAELGFKYGVAADAVKELQQNLAEATGKAAMLNDVDAEKFLQMNKLVGSNVTRQFTSEIMNHLGGQIHTVEGAVSKAYATAAKSGLNAAQFSEKVAKNLSMANKLSFRNGVNGIIKMTALSEKLGFNLQSVEAAANKFMDLDSAIESSAQLQMLGGAAGAYGSNPLTMAYEANYDPEAFTERMTKTLGGYATFDAKTGMANVNGMNRDFVKNIAQAMGISMDEAMSIAKKQAEIKYKESSGLNDKVRAMNLSDEQKDYLINASYVGKDGNLKMTDANGKERDVTSFSPDEIETMMSLQNMSDEEIMKQQALTLTSINERLKGLETSTVAELANGVNPNLNTIQNLINDFGPKIIQEAHNLAPKIGEAIGGITKFIHKNGDIIAEGIHKIGNFLGFIYDHWEIFLGVFLGIKFISWFAKFSGILGRGFNLLSKGGRTVTRGRAVTRTARAAAKGSNGLFSKTKLMGKELKTGYQLSRAEGAGRFGSIFKGLKLYGSEHFPKLSKMFSGGGKAAKLVKGGGVATVAVSSIFAGLDMNDYKKTMEKLQEELEKGRISQEEYNKQTKEAKDKKNEALGSGVGAIVGGAAGSFLDVFLGPFGTILGGMIGDFLGGLVGKAWNNISNTVSDFWNGTIRNIADKAFGKAGTAVVDAVSEVFDGLTTGFGTLLEGFFGGVGTFLGGLWDGIKTQFNGWTDGLTQIFKGDFVGGLKTIFVGQMKGMRQMLEGTVKGVWEIISAPFLGAWEAWKGVGRAVGKLWDGVVHYFNKAGEWIRKGWDGAMDGLSSLWGRFKSGLLSQISPENKEKIKAAIQNISEKWDTLTRNVSELWHGTIETISNAWNEYVATPAKNMWEGLVNTWNEYVAAPVKNIWDGMVNVWNEYVATPAKTVWNTITNAWNEYVVGPWKTFTSWIKGALQPIFDFFDGMWKGAKALWEKITSITPGDIVEMASKGLGKAANLAIDKLTGNASGGIVGGNSYSGDKVLTRVNSGEMILNASQQSGLFSFISNMPSMLSSFLTNSNDVKAKPVGEREYIYTPSNNNNGNGVTEVTVRDINLNINGTLKLDTGTLTKNLDMSQLLSDTTFISSLKDLIKQSINNDINNGRFMNDIASMRGMPSQVGLWGRK